MHQIDSQHLETLANLLKLMKLKPFYGKTTICWTKGFITLITKEEHVKIDT